MTVLSGNRWKGVLLLSVVLPVSFLISFKLSGFAGGPATIAETVTLEPAKWESERPLSAVYLGQQVNGSFFDAGSINSSVLVRNFVSNSVLNGGSDLLMMELNLTADLTEGYAQNVTVLIQGDSPVSWVMINGIASGGPSPMIRYENLNLTSYREGPSGQGNVDKAFVEFSGEDHPKRASISVLPWWLLEGSHNDTQQLTISFETTYFNGTAYKKVVQPFSLRLIGDDENTFDTAREVVANQTVIDFIGGDDHLDFFKINLRRGEIFNITVSPYFHSTWWVKWFLYGANEVNHPLANSSMYPEEYLRLQSIVYGIESSGWYYVKIECMAGSGPYAMTLTTIDEGS